MPAEERAERLPVWNDSGRVLQINEIFYSIEGEGLRVGEPTTFVRLARCNLRCPFCDTEFDRFTPMDIEDIAAEVARHPAEWVCLTGGEPLGQNLAALAGRLKEAGYKLHIETNGTIAPDPVLFELIDHWTVSPKCYPVVAGFARITELKYVVGRAFREERVEEHRLPTTSICSPNPPSRATCRRPLRSSSAIRAGGSPLAFTRRSTCLEN